MAEQKRSGFYGHKNYGAYAGDYVFNIKNLSNRGRTASGNSAQWNQMQKYQTERKIQDAWDSGDVGVNMGLIPDKYKEQAAEFIRAKAKEKGLIEQELYQMRESGNMSDDIYFQKKQQSDAISNMLGPDGSFTTFWKNFNQMSTEFGVAVAQSALSDTNDQGEIAGLADIFSNSTEMMIDYETGAISFGNDELGYTDMKELKKRMPYNKDFVSANKILAQSETLFKAGTKLDDESKLFYNNSFQEMMRKGGKNTVLSLAFDKLWSEDTLLNPENYVNIIEAIKGDDPIRAGQAMEILKRDLTNAYMGVLDGQATAGYNKKNPAMTTTTLDFADYNDPQGALSVSKLLTKGKDAYAHLGLVHNTENNSFSLPEDLTAMPLGQQEKLTTLLKQQKVLTEEQTLADVPADYNFQPIVINMAVGKLVKDINNAIGLDPKYKSKYNNKTLLKVVAVPNTNPPKFTVKTGDKYDYAQLRDLDYKTLMGYLNNPQIY